MTKSIYSTLTIFLFSAVAAISAPSNTVTLEMKLNIDNEIITKPTVNVAYGKTAKIEQMIHQTGEKVMIEITPTQDAANKNAIKLDFRVAKISKGVETTLSSPHVSTTLGKVARITQTADAKAAFRTLDLEVLAE